jgi:hypothetical protein
MESIRIGAIDTSNDGRRIDLILSMGEREFPVYFKSDDARLTPNPEAFLTIAILPAMKRRLRTIEIEADISPRFVEGLDRIQAVFRGWKPGYGQVETNELQKREDNPVIGGKTGVFFSAGVDSYYAFLDHRDEVEALIHLDGFDIPLRRQLIRQKTRDNVRKIGAAFDTRVIIVETNVREFLEAIVPWGFSHGSAIASVGHLLAPEFNRFYIASAGNPRSLHPYGVHPTLDPNWSSDRVEFVHAELIDRIEKCRYLGSFEPVLDTLRVCLRFPKKALNCGRCEKCLRTMVYMQASGCYEKFRVFENPLDLRQLYNYKRITPPERDLLYVALDELERQQTYPDTARALRKALHRTAFQTKLIERGRKIRVGIAKRIKSIIHPSGS